MVEMNLHGSCTLCGRKFETGDTKIVSGILLGAIGTMTTGVAGMDPASLKSYCTECAKKIFSK